MLNTELREGKQHCQKGTPEFLNHTLKLISELDLKENMMFRLDSGNDSRDIINTLGKSGHFYIIKRNLRKEMPEYWNDIAKSEGSIIYQDD